MRFKRLGALLLAVCLWPHQAASQPSAEEMIGLMDRHFGDNERERKLYMARMSWFYKHLVPAWSPVASCRDTPRYPWPFVLSGLSALALTNAQTEKRETIADIIAEKFDGETPSAETLVAASLAEPFACMIETAGHKVTAAAEIECWEKHFGDCKELWHLIELADGRRLAVRYHRGYFHLTRGDGLTLPMINYAIGWDTGERQVFDYLTFIEAFEAYRRKSEPDFERRSDIALRKKSLRGIYILMDILAGRDAPLSLDEVLRIPSGFFEYRSTFGAPQ